MNQNYKVELVRKGSEWQGTKQSSKQKEPQSKLNNFQQKHRELDPNCNRDMCLAMKTHTNHAIANVWHKKKSW